MIGEEESTRLTCNEYPYRCVRKCTSDFSNNFAFTTTGECECDPTGSECVGHSTCIITTNWIEWADVPTTPVIFVAVHVTGYELAVWADARVTVDQIAGTAFFDERKVINDGCPGYCVEDAVVIDVEIIINKTCEFCDEYVCDIVAVFEIENCFEVYLQRIAGPTGFCDKEEGISTDNTPAEIECVFDDTTSAGTIPDNDVPDIGQICSR